MYYQGHPAQQLIHEHAKADALSDDSSALCEPWTGIDDLATVMVWQACCAAAGITYRQPVWDATWAERFGRHVRGAVGERLKLAIRLFEAIKVKGLWPLGRVVWHDFLTEVQKWPGAQATGSAPPMGQGASKASGPTARVHRIGSKPRNSLSAVFDLARKRAPPGSPWTVVWESLVQIASDANRPLPLLGFTDDGEVKYLLNGKPKFLNREAFGRRHRKR